MLKELQIMLKNLSGWDLLSICYEESWRGSDFGKINLDNLWDTKWGLLTFIFSSLLHNKILLIFKLCSGVPSKITFDGLSFWGVTKIISGLSIFSPFLSLFTIKGTLLFISKIWTFLSGEDMWNCSSFFSHFWTDYYIKMT